MVNNVRPAMGMWIHLSIGQPGNLPAPENVVNAPRSAGARQTRFTPLDAACLTVGVPGVYYSARSQRKLTADNIHDHHGCYQRPSYLAG